MEFANRETRDFFNGIRSRAARTIVPAALIERALDKLTLIDAATSIDQLRIPPGNRLEQLRGDRKGQFSIRINDQYRICFRWTAVGAVDVEIVDYHG